MPSERTHRALVITREGGKVTTTPLPPGTARAAGLAAGEHADRQIVTGATGQQLDRHGAGQTVGRIARRARAASTSGRKLWHAFITAALDPAVPLRDMQEAPGTPARESRSGRARPPSTGTLPTSSPPLSPRRRAHRAGTAGQRVPAGRLL